MGSFEQVIGHEKIKEHLKHAIAQNKVSHAYIINGEAGSGKKTLAGIFAQTLQCQERGRGTEPCGKCKSCIQAETGNHPDIIRITHEKVGIGVDDIRNQVNGDVSIKPYVGPYKIYMIDEAHKMTEQAQNALLKTIEEPPAYGVVLLLTTNLDRLLPTIQSRCVLLNLKAVNPQEIKQLLMKKYGIPDYGAELSAAFSQGNVGRAIRYAMSDEFIKAKDEILHLLKYIDDMPIHEIMEAVKGLSAHKLEINDYIDLMILWYRDVLMLKATNDPNQLLYKEEYKYISRQASKKDFEGIENIMRAMNKAKVRLNANVNFDTVIELMLLTLKEN